MPNLPLSAGIWAFYHEFYRMPISDSALNFRNGLSDLGLSSCKSVLIALLKFDSFRPYTKSSNAFVEKGKEDCCGEIHKQSSK